MRDADAAYHFIDHDGPVLYFRTDLQAPRFRVIAVDVRHPERVNWKEIIPQGKDLLEGVSLVGEQFICEYLRVMPTARSSALICRGK